MLIHYLVLALIGINLMTNASSNEKQPKHSTRPVLGSVKVKRFQDSLKEYIEQKSTMISSNENSTQDNNNTRDTSWYKMSKLLEAVWHDRTILDSIKEKCSQDFEQAVNPKRSREQQ